MNKWIIAIDLDRCLLNYANVLSLKNQSTLQAAISQGAIIVIASGRMVPATRFILELVPGITAIVALNGALVFDATTETVLLERSLSPSEIIPLLRWCSDHDCKVILCHLEYASVSSFDGIVEEYASRTQVTMKLRESLSEALSLTVYKVLVYNNNLYKNDEFRLIEGLRRSGLVTNCTLYRSDHGYVEIVSADASKGKGLKIALEAFRLLELPLMVVGDGENDVSMMEIADSSYAVANACEEAKAAADLIVSDCDSDGVAEAITHFMKGLLSMSDPSGDERS